MRNPRLKEVMETSLYLNAADASEGDIRNEGNAGASQVGDSSVFDLIVSQRLEDAVNTAVANYRAC